MNSKDLWELLERLSEEDIKTMSTMSIIYLIKNRNNNLKDIIKDIKNVCRMVGEK